MNSGGHRKWDVTSLQNKSTGASEQKRMFSLSSTEIWQHSRFFCWGALPTKSWQYFLFWGAGSFGNCQSALLLLFGARSTQTGKAGLGY